MQLAGQREFAARALERERASLIQIGAALRRIEEGEFGICLDCEEPISPKRLAALPWGEQRTLEVTTKVVDLSNPAATAQATTKKAKPATGRRKRRKQRGNPKRRPPLPTQLS